jgi:hypothetical protein
MVKDVEDGRDEDDGDDGDDGHKKNSPLIRRSVPIISFISCEEERINIGKAN